jgi:hypothetical protein
MDGDRNNAFLHSSWNARATVVTKDKAYVLMFSTAHEKPLTSSNPPGANLDDRHERMDLCNNLWGATVPSVTDILTTNQTRPVNALWEDSRDMQEDGTTDSAMMSTDTCSGIRLYFIRKDNGEFFG